MTNGDRIRSMKDEEIAELFCEEGVSCNKCANHPDECNLECDKGHLEWLKWELKDDES